MLESIQKNIRMCRLKRKADYLIKHASQPHVQSEHMVSYPNQREPDYGLGPIWAVAVIFMIAVIAVVNFYYQESASCSIIVGN